MEWKKKKKKLKKQNIKKKKNEKGKVFQNSEKEYGDKRFQLVGSPPFENFNYI